MSSIEELGLDPAGKLSSLPAYRSGVNTGRRKPEKTGKWMFMTGYPYESRSGEKKLHWEWIDGVLKLGHRLGIFDCDGVKSFYVFVKE